MPETITLPELNDTSVRFEANGSLLFEADVIDLQIVMEQCIQGAKTNRDWIPRFAKRLETEYVKDDKLKPISFSQAWCIVKAIEERFFDLKKKLDGVSTSPNGSPESTHGKSRTEKPI